MALHYQTEYRLGDRGRICRSYTGFQAFVAIAFDLVFGLLFELVGSVLALVFLVLLWTARLVIRLLRIYWRFLVATMTAIVYVVTLPFVWVHQAVGRLRSGDREPRRASWRHRDAMAKPTWAWSREV
jgi:hypothetical protein